MPTQLDIKEFIQTRLNKILSKPNYPTLNYKFTNIQFGKRSQSDPNAYYIKVDFEASGLHRSETNSVLTGQYCTITTSRARLEDTVAVFLELETKLPQILTDLIQAVTDLTGHYTELAFNENEQDYNPELEINVFLEDDEEARLTSYCYESVDLYPANTYNYTIKVYYSVNPKAKYTRAQAKALVDEFAKRII
nr:MAG TPA: hypothetical protein [Bacteriophage sp.]